MSVGLAIYFTIDFFVIRPFVLCAVQNTHRSLCCLTVLFSLALFILTFCPHSVTLSLSFRFAHTFSSHVYSAHKAHHTQTGYKLGKQIIPVSSCHSHGQFQKSGAFASQIMHKFTNFRHKFHPFNILNVKSIHCNLNGQKRKRNN